MGRGGGGGGRRDCFSMNRVRSLERGEERWCGGEQLGMSRSCGWPSQEETVREKGGAQTRSQARGDVQGVLRECCPSGGAGGATDVLAMRSAG
jgi:hypothetical protein